MLLGVRLSEGLGHGGRWSVGVARRDSGADARLCTRAMRMRRAPMMMWVDSAKQVGKMPAASVRLSVADWILISNSCKFCLGVFQRRALQGKPY